MTGKIDLLSEVHFGGNFSQSAHLSFRLLAHVGQYFFGTQAHLFCRSIHASHALEVMQVVLWIFSCLQESHIMPLMHTLHVEILLQLWHFGSRFSPPAGQSPRSLNTRSTPFWTQTGLPVSVNHISWTCLVLPSWNHPSRRNACWPPVLLFILETRRALSAYTEWLVALSKRNRKLYPGYSAVATGSVRVLQREAIYKSYGSGRLLSQSTIVVFWPSWYRPAF